MVAARTGKIKAVVKRIAPLRLARQAERKKSPGNGKAALTTSNIALARGARAGSGEVGADAFALGREALRDL